MTVGDDTLYFTYGADGHPLTLTYNATTYFYVTNLQGDVVAILDSTGNPVVQYTYDAWGNVLSCEGNIPDTLGVLNPLRYRGYVYDVETGLYYLQSRYYDPDLGRFLNADAFVSTGQGQLGNNMFAYCLNNPVMYEDNTGELAYPGEIHDQVVKHIKNKYRFYKEQIILYPIGYGRADLISEDGQVWEVKPDNKRNIRKGKRQLQWYVANKWVKNFGLTLRVGGEIESDVFEYEARLATYLVFYDYHGDGIIVYHYTIIDYDVQTAVNVIGVALIASCGGIMKALADKQGVTTNRQFQH